jgi:DNA polymerase III epsilon subunit-like protein
MRFYIDLEATRFSNRIISIGVVAENGKSYYSLVKPAGKVKVDKFITALTGITNEMVAAAPTADEVFNQVFDFIELNNNTFPPEY